MYSVLKYAVYGGGEGRYKSIKCKKEKNAPRESLWLFDAHGVNVRG